MKTIEVLKEAGRVVLLAGLSYLLTGVVLNTLVQEIVGDRLSLEMIVVISGFITAVLRGVEKELHSTENKVQLPF